LCPLHIVMWIMHDAARVVIVPSAQASWPYSRRYRHKPTHVTMSPTHKELTRKELYDLVWSKPRTDLAKQFNISDVAFGRSQLSVSALTWARWSGLFRRLT
jgi:hypothetical protein